MPFDEISQKWTEGYAVRKGIPILPGIRVEQGEHAVTQEGIDIGTHNVLQCVVLHGYCPKTKRHGLIHIDGHTEISSAKIFFEKLGGDNIRLKVFGANSPDSSGLNDSIQNLHKTRLLLQDKQIKSLLKNQDIDSIFLEKDNELQDFVVNSAGEATKAMPEGALGYGAALHSIQEVRRQDRYVGTYPIVEAYDRNDNTVYINERAILKLEAYKRGALETQKQERHHLDSTDYTQYDASIPILVKEWQNSIGLILEHSANKHLDKKKVEEILQKTPMYIGNGSLEKNSGIIREIKASKDIRDLKQTLRSQPTSVNTISNALKIAASYDKDLDIESVLTTLEQKTGLQKADILDKEYDATISAEDFNTALQQCSPKLESLMILNSQGGYSSEKHRYHSIDEALRAAKNLASELYKTLEEKISEHNQKIAELKIVPEKSEIEEAFRDTSGKDIYFKKPTRIDSVFHTRDINDLEDLDAFLHKFRNSESDHKSAEEYKERLYKKIYELVERRKDEMIITPESTYSRIQNKFLEQVESLPRFNSLTISVEAAKKVEIDKSHTEELGVFSATGISQKTLKEAKRAAAPAKDMMKPSSGDSRIPSSTPSTKGRGSDDLPDH